MHHPVDDDPIMASAIGRCSNSWTHAEVTLSTIFSTLTEIKLTVAVTVFSFFKATRTQCDVIRKLCKITPFITDVLSTRLNKALKTYLALAEKRNELLHNPIGRSVENEVYIMLRKSAPDLDTIPYHVKPISPSEIDNLSEKINNLNRELLSLQQEIVNARFGIQGPFFAK